MHSRLQPLLFLAFAAGPAAAQDLGPWPQHSMDRPVPPVVTPAPAATPGAPPSDAVVLFDGQSLTGWETDSAKPAGWKVANGYMDSGVFLMSRYEIQVLDSYQNRTYADGQAGAVYGQYPPLANASRPPGEWQSYDIVFRAPRFDASGKLLAPARVTVFHNGVLVQDDVALSGPTAHMRRPPYRVHPDRLPLLLQDHGVPVRYRNIWIRDLHEPAP